MGRLRVWAGRPHNPLRWDPGQELEDIRREIVAGSAFVPPVDVYDDEAFIVTADLPGVREEDLAVSLEGGTLVIQGARAGEDGGGRKPLHTERRSGRFVRAVELPEPVESGAAKATLSSGVLEILLPRSAARAPREVAISVADHG